MTFKLLDRIISHRGASAYAPENTLASFNKALELGATCIEFDVVLSQDNEPFVFHDLSLNRTTTGTGQIGFVTSKYLRSLDAGIWFSKDFLEEKIPDLKTVIEWLVRTGVQANIEIKPYPGTAANTAHVVLEYLKTYWPAAKPLPLVSSFDFHVLELCHMLNSSLPLGLLMHRWNTNWQDVAEKLECYSIHINQNILTRERARVIKLGNYHLFAYTVNDKEKAKELFEWGVDAVFSDYPDLLK